MKKIVGLSTLALAGVLAFTGCSGKEEEKLKDLPAARLSDCNSNDYDYTCSSITTKNLLDYYDRSDVAYIDLRDFKDYQPSHLKGFSNVQFFANIYGDTNQLFKSDYTARYKDSVEILKTLIPQDKTVFLMCQSGARVVHMMNILELNGWDMTKVYNVGGMSQYSNDDKYANYTVSHSNAELTYKTGTDKESANGGNYTTTAYVTVDANNKITNVYVTGTKEYTTGKAEGWDQDTWLNAKYDYCQKLVGKTLAEVKALLGTSNKATGSDVVTGASLSSNRVLRAVVNALEAA